MAYSPGRSGTAWNKLRAQVFAEETHCWICRRWVDQTLDRRHPMSRTVDHVQQLGMGGEPLDRANCRLAHRKCNTQKSNQVRAKRRPKSALTVAASDL